jgi:hypothetical protein
MITLRFRVSAVLSLVLACSSVSLAQDRLVNMVPNSRSGETNQDAEPTITVDPNNTSRLVWLKCPMCGIQIFVNPGEEYKRVTVYDTLGKEVGELQRLQRPVVERGVTYTNSIRLKAQKGVGYVLRASVAPGQKLRGTFAPKYVVKMEKSGKTR